jgi:hypothetical protein
LNILITNIQLTVPGGTVVYVQYLAHGLRNRGHSVEIYTLTTGAAGHDLVEKGFNVVTNLSYLKNQPDIIHAHHNPVTMDVLKKFSNTPVIFFLHDSTSPFDHPVKHANIIRHVAVDYNCLGRLLNQLEEKQTAVIYNWVNTARFRMRQQFNGKPAKALVFSNYATRSNHYKIIERACSMAGLQLDVIGSGMGKSVKNPETVLPQYDIVFAKAKAAMEALATGAAVIPCDFAGMGEMISQTNMLHYRKYNFGRKILTKPIEAATIIAEIKKYSSSENRLNAMAIASEASFEKILEQLLELYGNSIKAFAASERGPSGNRLQPLRSYYYKTYYYFTRTTIFKILSSLKYRIKNAFIK